jgi:drug/metabolite transporter (DMT)-like permease
MALFGATSIVLVNILGVLLLDEVLTLRGYAGVTLAILAFLVMALGK